MNLIRAFVLVVALAVASCGCSSAAPLEKAISTGARFAELAEPVLVEVYRAEQKACLEQLDGPMRSECVGNVRTRWRPLLDAYDGARHAWCALDELAGDARCAP